MEREQLNFLLQQAPANLRTALCSHISESADVVLLQKPTFQTLLLPDYRWQIL